MSVFTWGSDACALHLDFDESRPVGVALAGRSAWSASGASDAQDTDRFQLLIEILAIEAGRSRNNTRMDQTVVGESLRYAGHEVGADGDWQVLTIRQTSSQFGLEVTTTLRQTDGAGGIRFATEVVNSGTQRLTLTGISTAVIADGLGVLGDPDDLDLVSARSTWSCESRWGSRPLRGSQGIPPYSDHKHDDQTSREVIRGVGHSSWSTDGDLPMAMIVNRVTGRTLAWEVENNGPWSWELIAQHDEGRTFSLALLGPTDLQHSWCLTLEPGQRFRTVLASVFTADGGVDGAAGTITRHRRASQHPAVDPSRPGVIFNDYMNTLMGDPTTEKLLPLIDAAADIGADTFCIDAGWYDDGGNWWPSVGQWEPSTVRFPDGGLRRVLDRIRERGMRPGLWIEPEVVGVNSPMASVLPDEAFMTRNGARIREHDRYLLDLRSEASRDHLDSVFDRLVGDLGAGYFKWDFNVTPGTGPDRDAESPGVGLLDHCKALDEWAYRLRSRLEGVCIEACSSGAMRMDAHWVRLFDLQSTSDQQDLDRYATIAAAAPMMLPPEKAGNWAYPEPWMSLEETAFTMVNGLAGRLYLSGKLDELGAEQLAVIAEGVEHYRAHPDVAAASLPFWPAGLPAWDDPFVALGLRGEDSTFLFLWKRGEVGTQQLTVSSSGFRSAEVVYPTTLDGWAVETDGEAGTITVDPTPGDGLSARIIRIDHC